MQRTVGSHSGYTRRRCAERWPRRRGARQVRESTWRGYRPLMAQGAATAQGAVDRNRHRASGCASTWAGGEDTPEVGDGVEFGGGGGGSTQAQLLAAARSDPALQGHAPQCRLPAALPPRGGCRGRSRLGRVPARRVGQSCRRPRPWRGSRPSGAASSRTCSSGAQRGTDHSRHGFALRMNVPWASLYPMAVDGIPERELPPFPRPPALPAGAGAAGSPEYSPPARPRPPRCWPGARRGCRLSICRIELISLVTARGTTIGVASRNAAMQASVTRLTREIGCWVLAASRRRSSTSASKSRSISANWHAALGPNLSWCCRAIVARAPDRSGQVAGNGCGRG